jgi:hypothetical protein
MIIFDLKLAFFLLIFRNIINYVVDWDALCDAVSEDAADLVSRLLIEDPHERLGFGGAEEAWGIIRTFILILFDIQPNR